MKKILIILTVLMFLLSFPLVACNGSSETETNNAGNKVEEPEEIVKEYDKLSFDEKRFFDSFTLMVFSKIKDPASILFHGEIKSAYNRAVLYFTISGGNGFGSTTTQEYILFRSNWTMPGKEPNYDGTFISSLYMGTIMTPKEVVDAKNMVASMKRAIIEPENLDDIEYSLLKINNALEEYKKEKGYMK